MRVIQIFFMLVTNVLQGQAAEPRCIHIETIPYKF
jgi:hypothetical protein